MMRAAGRSDGQEQERGEKKDVFYRTFIHKYMFIHTHMRRNKNTHMSQSLIHTDRVKLKRYFRINSANKETGAGRFMLMEL